MSDTLVPSSVDTSANAAPTPSAPAAPAATPPAPPVADSSQAPATGAAPTGGGIPQVEPSWLKGRLDETRQAAYRQAQAYYQQQQDAWNQQREQYENKIRALVGMAPPENPEVDQIRNQLFQVAPELKDLMEMVEDLKALRQQAGGLKQLEEQYWNQTGRSTVDRLFTQAQTAVGSQLSPEAKAFLHQAFVGHVQANQEAYQRYISGDTSLVDDFVRAFTAGFIDPSRRQATATVVGRAPSNLPQDTPSGAPMIPGAPKPKDLDERAAAAWASFTAGKQL